MDLIVCPRSVMHAKPQTLEGLGVCSQGGADVPGSHCGLGLLSFGSH